MKFLYFFPVFATAAFAISPIEAQEPYATAKPVPDYIRYQKATAKGQPDALETAVSRFQKGDHTVDLISVVHLGDAAYFKKLKDSLKAYDAVFYEMVGGPYTEEKARLAKEQQGEGDMAQVQQLQKLATSLLGLEFQLEGLDYLAPNFVHADMTAEEFAEHTDGSHGISELLSSALKIAQSGKIRGLPSSEGDANQLMSQLMSSVLTGNSNQLKRTLGPILAEAELFITEMEEEEGTVLISRRNEIVIEKMNEYLATRDAGAKTDAILYGAGHMPDLESRLIAEGYVKAATNWEPGWLIAEGANRNEEAPSLDQMLQQIGGLMEMLNGQ